MNQTAMTDPSLIRMGFFIGTLLLCLLWENKLPRKSWTVSRSFRWLNNLSLVLLNSVLVALLLPIVAFQAAILAQQHQFGLFHLLGLNDIVNILLSVLMLDLIIYCQHLLFHRVKPLWRLHRMHHADLDIDVTTGTRFHPIEILLSMVIKITFVSLLGVSPLAVVVFEIILNVSAMFNHSNAKLPLTLDHWLRKWIVTPDMHRVHHSTEVKETHSNFGFFLSVWDRCFRTYRAQPKAGHEGVVIGIPEVRNPDEQRLDKMLTQPFRNHF
ncbi:sterol desaturase family protein [Vibrio vulnificus]|nr:sterol desaturase family protein [Vibrio vulnificus]ELG4785575.1 sterol desaturase family protein [Vibrio vulnificus]